MPQPHSAAHLTRRQFMLAAGAAGLVPLAACGRLAWQPDKQPAVPRVGILLGTTFSGSGPANEPFRQGLNALGYTEGQNIVLEYRAAGGREERLPALAAELVELPVNVLVAVGDPPIRAAAQATSTIPIVMGASRDPVGQGFIASLARPGGNITGLSLLQVPMTSKRLELLKEAVPTLTRVAVLGSATSTAELEAARVAAPLLGLQLHWLQVDSPDDLERAFDTATQARADGLFVLLSPLAVASTRRIAELAAERRLPLIGPDARFARDGGLMSYGPNVNNMLRRAATFVDKLLKGASPADLPVEQPTTFELIFNDKTAQALGLAIPYRLQIQVTEVVQ